MDTPNSTKAISLTTYLITGVVLFLAGAVVWIFVDPYLPASVSNSQRGYQTGFAAARTLAENSSLGNFFRTQIDKSTIGGTVTAIQDNRIQIHDGSLQNDSLNTLFDVPFIVDRTIIVDANTKIVKIAENTTTAKPQTGIPYQVVRQIKPDGSTPSPVASSTAGTYTETPASVSAITVGDVLIVVAGESTKTATEVVAQKILISPSIK